MQCTESRELMDAYLDGELDLRGNLEIEKHLQVCAACARLYASGRALQAAFRQDGLHFAPRAGLQRQVMSAVKKAHAARTGWTPNLAWSGALAAGLAAAVLVLRLVMPGEQPQDAFVTELASDHVRSLMADHLTDVLSSDQHTVKPWFDGKLDFAPPVTDLKDQGFPLVGGRLDYLDGHPVAALVYQRRLHYINVFVWPTDGGTPVTGMKASHDGYNLVHWTRSGMNFWAVSDLNGSELQNFADLLQNQP